MLSDVSIDTAFAHLFEEFDMTSFKLHTVENTTDAAKPLLQGAKDSIGFVPNLFAGMAEAPALLEAYMTVSGIFNKTNLSETERQIILMTNNRLNGCTYCMAAHTALSQMGGVAADVIDALRNNTPIADPKLEALRQFTEVINQTRGWPSDGDVSRFINAGYTRQTVLEVVLGSALKVMSNYTNHIVKTPLDGAFQGNAWTAK
jgi:uncharacterized peroxidase-related enzyme